MKNALQILERKVRDLKSRPTTHWVDVDTCAKLMIEFAKMHVEAALKEAADQVDTGNQDFTYIDRETILNAYPLTNIK